MWCAEIPGLLWIATARVIVEEKYRYGSNMYTSPVK